MMNKPIKFLLLSVTMVSLFTSCARKKIVIPAPEVKRTQINTWAQQTNVKEDIDISDLEEKSLPRPSVSPNMNSKMERVRFPTEEYNRLAKVGNSTIKGSIYLKNAYDKHIVGANTRLYLNPVTSYSKQWYYESYLGGHKMEKADSRLFNYLRFTTSNEQGEFAFHGVPAGKYYLIGTVKCAAECGYSTPKNIRIATEVTLHSSQVMSKQLTKLID